MAILLTGAAGFIGYHVAEALLARGETVVGIDDLNPYYSVQLKEARLARLVGRPGFSFAQIDIADMAALSAVAARHPAIDRIVHLAAQAGVRYSLVAPFDYARANLVGQLAILELARTMTGLRHLVYASSSSVYGASQHLPFREDDRADTPLSLYAASKRSGELMAYSYAHLFHIPVSGLRFFTVYGPWGRPDMAYYLFADAIMAGEPLTVYDGGAVRRDFTYVDDIVAGVLGCLDHPPRDEGGPPARVFNIGNNRSEAVVDLIAALEQALGRKAILRSAPRPAADVGETRADVSELGTLAGFVPSTSLADGIPRFASWYLGWREQGGDAGVG